MNFLSDFHFIRPMWLLLTPVLVGDWWQARQSQDPLRGWRAIMDQPLLSALAVGGDHRIRSRNTAKLVFGIMALIAVAGPTWRPEPSPFADDPVPVMILLKADETMDLADFLPSRMERARLKVADFANERTGQPLGLMAYAGSAHLVLPPTRDTAVVAQMATEISPAIMPKPGDDLSAALRQADGILQETGGSIVVVADTIPPSEQNALTEFRSQSDRSVFILAVARNDTPELDAIRQASSSLRAQVTAITPDDEDIRSLVRSVASTPVSMSAAGEGTRWSEAGWWLVPVIALFSLASFRRVENVIEEARS